MKKWIPILLTPPVLLIAAFSVRNSLQWHRLHRTIEEMQTKVAQAHLVGKSPGEVIRFLNQENLHHSDYMNAATRQREKLGPGSNKIIADVDGMIDTMSLQYGPENWYVKIYFEFDASDKLRSAAVGKEGIGL